MPICKLYTFQPFSKETSLVLEILHNSAVFNACEVVSLITHPEHIPTLSKSLARIDRLLLPVVEIDGKVFTGQITDLPEHLSSIERAVPSEIDLKSTPPASAGDDITPSLPLIKFLDKEWRWANLLLYLIETFGISVQKSKQDPAVPEDFLIDCIERNLGVKLLKDSQLILFEAAYCGMLIETQHERYKLAYHVEFGCLNGSRRNGDMVIDGREVGLPVLTEKMAEMFGCIRRAHSDEFLEFVDLAHLLRVVGFKAFLQSSEIGSQVKLRTLTLLAAMMASHIDVHEVLLETERNEFFYQFKDQRVRYPDISAAIMSIGKQTDTSPLQCLLLLRWTLPLDVALQAAVLEAALAVVKIATLANQNGVEFVPKFIAKHFNDRKIKTYPIAISPFISPITL